MVEVTTEGILASVEISKKRTGLMRVSPAA